MDLVVGNHSLSAIRTFDGRIDEVRIADSPWTADEIAAQYSNVSGNFATGSVVVSGPGGVLNNDSDAEGSTLSVALVTGPVNAASFSLAADGSFTYVHDGSETTSDSFVYSVTDGTTTTTATASLTIALQNENAPIITGGQSFNLSESAANNDPIGAVVATDADVGTTFSNWTITSGNADGIFAINSATGMLSVLSNANLDFETTTNYTLGITVSDGANTSAVETVAISILPENDNLPVVDPAQTFNVSELAANGTSLGVVTATDNDAGTTFSSWTITSGNADGNFSINGSTGELTILSNANLDFETTTNYTLGISVSDGANTSAIETIAVNVLPENDNTPVIATGQTFNLSELAANGDPIGTLIATDADAGTTFTNWTITSGNADGIFAINSATGALSVLSNANLDFETTTSYTLGFTVSDGVNTSAIESVAISILPENDNAPVVTPSLSFNVSESASIGTSVGIVTATDDDAGTTFSNWQITSGNSDGNFTIDANTGELTILNNANLDFETTANYTLGVTVSDGLNTSSTETVSISVTNANETPTAITLSNLSVSENQAGAIVGNLSTTDPDVSDTHTYSVDDIRFTVSGNQLRLRAGESLDFETEPTVNLNITTTDSASATFVQSFTVNVLDVNDAPTVGITQFVTNISEDADTTLPIVVATFSVTDDALGTNNMSIIGADAGMFQINGNNLELVAGATLDFSTNPRLDLGIAVDDPTIGAGIDDWVAMSINVDKVNVAPVSNSDFYTTEVGSLNVPVGASLLINDVDANGDVLSVILVQGPRHGTLQLNANGTFTYTPNADFTGVDTFAYKSFDGAVDSNVALVSIQVTPLLSPPVSFEPPASTEAETTESSESEDTTTSDSGDAEDIADIVPPVSANTSSQSSSETVAIEQLTDTPSSDTVGVIDGTRDNLVEEVSRGGTASTLRSISASEQSSRSLRALGVDFDTRSTSAYRAAIDSRLSFVSQPSQLWQQLDTFREGNEESYFFEDVLVGSVSGVTSGLTVGYVVWMLRGGVLISSLMAQLPAWKLIDPIVVLAAIDDDLDLQDEESIQSIVDQGIEEPTVENENLKI